MPDTFPLLLKLIFIHIFLTVEIPHSSILNPKLTKSIGVDSFRMTGFCGVLGEGSSDDSLLIYKKIKISVNRRCFLPLFSLKFIVIPSDSTYLIYTNLRMFGG